MDGDERQISHFFIGVSRGAHRWLNVLRFVFLPWRCGCLGLRAPRRAPRGAASTSNAIGGGLSFSELPVGP